MRKRHWLGMFLVAATAGIWSYTFVSLFGREASQSIILLSHEQELRPEVAPEEPRATERTTQAPEAGAGEGPVAEREAPFGDDFPANDPGLDSEIRRLVDQGAPPELIDEVVKMLLEQRENGIAPKVSPGDSVPDGVETLPSMEEYSLLARRDNVPGALGVKEVKFLCVDVESDDPKVYFINTGRHPYHYCYVRDVLRHGIGMGRFKSLTYNRDQGRRYLAGSLLAHESFEREDGGQGIFTIEFWPTDSIPFHYIETAHRLVSEGMLFAGDHVYYHPNGETQEGRVRSEQILYDGSNVPLITSDELFGKFRFSPLNRGEAFGLLKVAEPSATYSARDIVIFRTLPNDLNLTAGIITEVAQTPLSHVNLKAQQNGIPNAYVKAASSDPEITPLIGEYVRYEVTSDSYTLERADPAQVEAYLETIRPEKAPRLDRDLTVQEIMPLSRIGFYDASAFGVKAANVAELGKFLPVGMVPNGYAVPFYYYDEFMKYNGFYEEAAAMISNEEFSRDPATRSETLKRFRKKIRLGLLPEWMMQNLDTMHKAFPEGANPRCRSSTNNEDLEDFNGAGLYESYTHRPDEGHISKSIKQVWASLWTYRAFEERDFYRVNHLEVAMGVLVHPNFDDERANGVGITRNIFDPRWPGFYVNVQTGEDLVTNPEEESIPEEFLISYMLTDDGPSRYKFEIQYARSSNRVPEGQRIIERSAAVNLARIMHTIQQRFQELYNREGDEDFAMDIEFKITSDGRLVVKQARPWVCPSLPEAENTDC